MSNRSHSRRPERRLEQLENAGRDPATEAPYDAGPSEALTGLGHRQPLLDRLADELERARRSDEPGAAVVVLGLDRFKAINGSLGYGVGDRVLIEAARRLESAVRAGDFAARLGADELAILLTGLHDLAQAQRFADDILERLRWPMCLAGRRISVTASSGLAWIDAHYTRPDEILRDAEIAMSRAKASGRDRWCVFDAAQHGPRIRQLEIETELRGALERQELCLHYQPIVELASGRLRGFEALARWQHPRRGLLRPRDFLSAAADVGLMPEICRWTLEAACRRLASWQSRFPQGKHWAMSVNIDAQHLTEPGFADAVDLILRRSGLGPSQLILEVTETAMMSSSTAATAMLHEIEDRGIALHIDDFGTGYATLSYLHRVPSRAVKIDASFITEMPSDDRHREIVRSIVDLAHNLGLEVIAEGVETPLHLAALRQLGCDHGQGFYFSRPLDAEALAVLLADETLWKEAAKVS